MYTINRACHLEATSSDDNDEATASPRPSRINPKPSSFGHNHRSILDSSESEDDQGLYARLKKHSRQSRSMNDISSLLRMIKMIDLNQRGVGAGANVGVGRSRLTINHNRRTIEDYSDSCTYDEGLTHHHGKIKHFSHPHNLNKYNFQQYSESNCKVCGLQLVGWGYGCQSCQFCVHISCFDLSQKIQHDVHPLTLRCPSYTSTAGSTVTLVVKTLSGVFSTAVISAI